MYIYITCSRCYFKAGYKIKKYICIMIFNAFNLEIILMSFDLGLTVLRDSISHML